MSARGFLVAMCLICGSANLLNAGEFDYGAPWKRHTIDDTSRGADGIDIADINGDGHQDLTVGWEEGGVIRVYLNPGPKAAAKPWPQVTVGRVRSPEDARFADMDGNGTLDVVSCTEGGNREMYIHWAPGKDELLVADAWKTERFSPPEPRRLWMFSHPVQIDGQQGTDLVAGSKGGGAVIGWYQAPVDPQNIQDWKFHTIYNAGWIMSLFSMDMDDDGDADVLTSDRKGGNRGCYWLENPGKSGDQTALWKPHPIGGQQKQVMFMVQGTLDDSSRKDFLVAVSGQELLYFEQTESDQWKTHTISLPENTGTGKGVAIADVDLNGVPDVLFTCENSQEKHGVMWLSRTKDSDFRTAKWTPHAISGHTGKAGVKFDLIQLLDLDADGDLDLLTCEERHNLGVIWYENPTKTPKP